MDNFTNIHHAISNKAIKYVLCIAECKNITRASEQLFISQPALSQFLDKLESSIGCSLFIREGRKLFPTYAGECFIRHAQVIRDTENLLVHELVNCASDTTGHIRFGLPQLRSSYLLPMIVPEFRRVYPHVELEVFDRHADELTELWKNRKLDFLISNFIPKDFTENRMLFRKERILLAIPPEHPLASLGTRPKPGERYGTIDVAAFKNEDFIMQYPTQRTRQLADTICKEAGFTPNIILVTRSVESSLRLVRKGCGICFCSESMAYHISLANPPLLFYCNSDVTMEFALSFVDITQQPPHFKFFLDLLQEKVFSDYR